MVGGGGGLDISAITASETIKEQNLNKKKTSREEEKEGGGWWVLLQLCFQMSKTVQQCPLARKQIVKMMGDAIVAPNQTKY